jgi:prevent-host-death family protein
MISISIPEAQAHLSEIVENLQPGEEVVLTRNQQPVARLVPFAAPLAVAPPCPQPVFGSCRGKLIIVAEDEEHLGDFSDYMP